MVFRDTYNIIDMLELIDDLEQLITIKMLSNTEKKIITALSEADYNYLSLQELQKVTQIPLRTLKRLITKLESFKIVKSIRDAVKFIELNPALLRKREIFRWVRLNAIRIEKLEKITKTFTFKIKDLNSEVNDLNFKINNLDSEINNVKNKIEILENNR